MDEKELEELNKDARVEVDPETLDTRPFDVREVFEKDLCPDIEALTAKAAKLGIPIVVICNVGKTEDNYLDAMYADLAGRGYSDAQEVVISIAENGVEGLLKDIDTHTLGSELGRRLIEGLHDEDDPEEAEG